MTIQLGLIGCGRISRRHVLAMQDLIRRGRGGFVVRAVCDANPDAAAERADMLEELLGLRPSIHASHRDLIESGQVDAVDLCLPHGLHHGIAVDCMEAGLDALCEKPLGITVRACRLMAETAARAGVFLSTAAPHRRQPGQRVAKWVFEESGLMGAPVSFFHQYRSSAILSSRAEGAGGQPNPSQLWGQPAQGGQEPLPEHKRWRQDKRMSGGGPVLDSGFHYCDSLRYLLGEVDTVYAVMRSVKSGAPLPWGEGPEDTVFVTFTFESGVAGSWAWSLAAPGEEAYDVTFYGSQGSLRDTTGAPFSIFHLFQRTPQQNEAARLRRADGDVYSMAQLEEMYRSSLSEEEEEHLFPGGAADGFAVEIWEFLELLRGRRDRPEIDAWEGTRSLALGHAIYESALAGEPVRVNDVLSGTRSAYQDEIDSFWGLKDSSR